MRRCLILAALLATLLFSPSCVSQTSRPVLDTQRIFITSFFDCPVYWGNKQIATLKKGTRARLLASTRSWILVRFWSDDRYIVGWIRR